MEWGDAHATARWVSPQEIDEYHGPLVVTWVGYLIKQNDRGVTLSFGLDANGTSAGNMFVPTGMIRKITKVRY